MDAQSAATATKTTVAAPAATSSKAPAVAALAGQVLAPVVKSMPKSTTMSATIVIGGKTVSLGSVKTNSSGTATLPAIKVTKAGTYVIQMTSGSGAKYFIKVVVKAK